MGLVMVFTLDPMVNKILSNVRRSDLHADGFGDTRCSLLAENGHHRRKRRTPVLEGSAGEHSPQDVHLALHESDRGAKGRGA